MPYLALPGPPKTAGLPPGSGLAIRPGQKIVFDGDSLTGGSPDASYRWQAPLEAALTAWFTGNGVATPTYANTGVPSNTTTDMLAAVASVTAQTPDHVITLCGVNDPFNHGGSPIPNATTQANYTAYFAAIKASRPNCRFHVISNLWVFENWPDGVNTDDTSVQNVNTAIAAAVALESQAEYINIRREIYGFYGPLQNPTHLTTGVFTQDGVHPTKTAGQVVISCAVFRRLGLGL